MASSSAESLLNEAIQQIYSVLKHGDKETGVLTELFDGGYFEQDPALITKGYLDYLEVQDELMKEETKEAESEKNKGEDEDKDDEGEEEEDDDDEGEEEEEEEEQKEEKEQEKEKEQEEEEEQKVDENDENNNDSNIKNSEGNTNIAINKDNQEKDEKNLQEDAKSQRQIRLPQNATCIEQRFNENFYNSIYRLYHDIKLSSIVLISRNKLGSEQYLQIDSFYRFATELILHEAHRLHLGLKEFETSYMKAEEESGLSEFSESLSNDFTKIVTSFKYANNESLFVLTGHNNSLPLFSSLGKKSELDQNEQPMPTPFNAMKVLPQAASVPAANLGFISPNPIKVYDSTVPLEITRQIFHPNWFSLPSIPWLEFQSSNTFIPLIDETISVINSKNKGKVYYEQVGLQRLVKLRNKHYDAVKAAAKGTAKETDKNDKEADKNDKEADKNKDKEADKETDKGSDKETDKGSDKGSNKETDREVDKETESIVSDKTVEENDIVLNGKAEEKPGTEVGKNPEEKSNEEHEALGKLDIDLKNLFEWRLENKFEQDEIEAFQKGEEQKYLNKLLIDLNKLRAERYVLAKPTADATPTSKEKHLHSKIKRILQGIVGHLTPGDLVDNSLELDDKDGKQDAGLRLSSKLPALGMNYSGTLQAPLPIQYNAGRASQRYQALPAHRTYKKRKYQ